MLGWPPDGAHHRHDPLARRARAPARFLASVGLQQVQPDLAD